MTDYANLSWNQNTEYDNLASETRVVHDNHGDRSDATLTPGYSPANLPGTPTAYWTMDDSSSQFVDVINGYNADIGSGVTTDIGGVGTTTAAQFDGTTSSACPINTLNYNTSGVISQMSVAAWVNPDSLNQEQGCIVSFDRSEYFRFAINGGAGTPPGNGYCNFGTTDSGASIDDFYTASPLSTGSWQLIVAVYDGTDKVWYINGTEDARDSNPHGGSNLGTGTTRYGYLGEGSESSSFNGSTNGINPTGDADEIILWDNYALSSSEVQTLYDTFTVGGSATTATKVT